MRRDEHFRHSVQRWSCSASPIYDPNSGELLGVLDITGAGDIAVPQTLAMVRAAVRMAETELRRDHLMRAVQPAPAAGSLRVVIETLGRNDSIVQIDDLRGRRHEVRLSPRHSEILLLLASSANGLTGDELAVLLYEDDGGTSTLRAELNRLRGLLGDEFLRSRPYRLGCSITIDWLAVEAQLAAGDVRAALHAYRGPLLPRSSAPGVVALRDQLHFGMREAVRTSGEPDLMAIWTRSAWGRDDYDMWLAQRDAVAHLAPIHSLIDGQLTRLDAELG